MKTTIFLLGLSLAISQDVTVWVSNATLDFVEISMTNTADVAGFQLNILADDQFAATGFTDMGMGSAAAAGFMVSTSSSGLVLGFSLTGATIPPGSGPLVTLSWDINDVEGYIDLDVMNFAGVGGGALFFAVGSPFHYPQAGCTDISACNFDPNATVDDGSCYYTEMFWADSDGDTIGAGEGILYCPGDQPEGWVTIDGDNCPELYNPNQTDGDSNGLGDACQTGCTEEAGINFDPFAGMDDGSCYYLDDIVPHFTSIQLSYPYHPMGIYIAAATIGESELRVGDEIAIFDGDACITSVQLLSEIVPFLQIFVSEDNPDTPEQDGFIVGHEILYRFWDASEQAESINIAATVTNGSAEFEPFGYSFVDLQIEPVYGCIDSEAINYDPESNTDDGSCIYPYPGCMDTEACNYDPEANIEDGSCEYWDCSGVCGGDAIVDECAVCDDDPNNDNACFGCMDVLAMNYNPEATIDTGCEYPGMGDLSMDGVLNVIDIVYLVDVAINNLPFVFYADFNGDGFNNIIDIVILVDIIFNPTSLGCTDPLANNYNPLAIYDNGDCDYNHVTDIDGNTYQTITIGNQEWMAENLKVTHYRSGNEIPNITNDSDWGSLSTGAYGVYNNDPANAETYGNLYNWYAVDDDRGICPEGWHVPTDEEWMELEMTLGMSYEAAHDLGWRGTDQGSQLAGNAALWDNGALENDPAFGSSGFLALPGGARDYYSGTYYAVGNYGYFWSYTANSSSYYAWLRLLNCNISEVYRHANHMSYGYSVRCVRPVGTR